MILVGLVDEVAAQLGEELGSSARALGALLGLDVLQVLEQRIADRAPMLAAQLCGDDDRLAADTVLEVMAARWPDGADPSPEWWRSPIGRMIARSTGAQDADAVSVTVAAAMLGISPRSVSQALQRADKGLPGSGGLERHPDGGVTRASVLARIGKQP